MGREVRLVPPSWEHPKTPAGDHIPLLSETETQWREEKAKWDRGFIRAYGKPGRQYKPKGPDETGPFSEYYGPLECEGTGRMPDFEPGTATHLMMYEDCSEGTPISPAFADPEELARWLADNNASAFGNEGASYEAWLATIKKGYALSLIISLEGGVQSGVEFNEKY